MSCECFQKELAFEMESWVKKTILTRTCGHHSTHWEWIEQKGKGRANLFFVWTGVTVSSCPQTMILIGSWDLKSAKKHHWLSWVSCLQKTVQVTFIYLSITYWFCSSEEPWLIQMGTWQRKYHWLSWVEKKKVKKLSWYFGKALVNLTKKKNRSHFKCLNRRNLIQAIGNT